ncbi:hypothetical protein [Weissella bombi]|uniref:Phage transcriptional regulator, ArpU family n=1 Tax=Weissella bombi TaxID=1505725 RepID=A0A1C4AWU5_9LACO|nr:hypothetical protein [Weissella bombi]SCB99079.1 phage transcriptional regulator, ArpU family [Weissella bombi]
MLSILDTGKDLDEKATIRNVREFFNRELPIIKARAHQAYIDIQNYDFKNIPNDEKLSNYMQACQRLDEIVKAVIAIPTKNRQFIDYRYMKYKQWLEIEELSGYSRKRGQELLNEAFLYFANGFTDTYDFRVWY